MSYLSIDVYNDAKKAQVAAAKLKQQGRNKVRIEEWDGVTARDCTQEFCVPNLNLDGSPLYVVLSEG